MFYVNKNPGVPWTQCKRASRVQADLLLHTPQRWGEGVRVRLNEWWLMLTCTHLTTWPCLLDATNTICLMRLLNTAQSITIILAASGFWFVAGVVDIVVSLASLSIHTGHSQQVACTRFIAAPCKSCQQATLMWIQYLLSLNCRQAVPHTKPLVMFMEDWHKLLLVMQFWYSVYPPLAVAAVVANEFSGLAIVLLWRTTVMVLIVLNYLCWRHCIRRQRFYTLSDNMTNSVVILMYCFLITSKTSSKKLWKQLGY